MTAKSRIKIKPPKQRNDNKRAGRFPFANLNDNKVNNSITPAKEREKARKTARIITAMPQLTNLFFLPKDRDSLYAKEQHSPNKAKLVKASGKTRKEDIRTFDIKALLS